MAVKDLRLEWTKNREEMRFQTEESKLSQVDMIHAIQILDCVQRPLMPDELLVALSVDTKNLTVDASKRARLGNGKDLFSNYPELFHITRKPAEGQPLVTRDESMNGYSAEVVQARSDNSTASDAWLRDGHALLCMVSLTCLRSLHRGDQTQSWLKPFGAYAGRCWVDHARKVNDDQKLNNLVVSFLEDISAVEIWLGIYDIEEQFLRGVMAPRRYDWKPACRSPLYHSAFHRLRASTDILLSRPNIRPEDLDESIYAGCFCSDLRLVELLLDRGVSPNAEYGPLESLLAAAAAGGSIAIINLLLARGALVAEDADAVHPLAIATVGGHEKIVEIICKNTGWTNKVPVLNHCLYDLHTKGMICRRRRIVDLLLEHGASQIAALPGLNEPLD